MLRNKRMLIVGGVLVGLLSCKQEKTAAVREPLPVSYSVERNRAEHLHKEVVWFKLKLENPQNTNHSSLSHNKTYEEYAGALDYYLNHAIEDIVLEVCNAKVKPVSYHFENNHNIVGYDMINVGFDKDLLPAGCIEAAFLIFNDRNYNNAMFRVAVNID